MQTFAIAFVPASAAAVLMLLQPAAGAQPTWDAVASQRVTLTARPTTLRWTQGATLFGVVDSRRADEEVTLEAKDCGQRSFTGVAAILTHAGGTWSTVFGRGITTTLRAVWKGAVSAPVTLRQQPGIVLARRSSRRFEVGVGGRGQFWRKRVLVQRRDRGRWTTLRSVVLTETFAPPGTGVAWSTAEIRLSVAKGSALRAVLPRSQARPCFVTATSSTVRT